MSPDRAPETVVGVIRPAAKELTMSLTTTPTEIDVPRATAPVPGAEGTVRAAARAWARQDEETLHRLLDDDVRWIPAEGSPAAGARRGREAVIALRRRIATSWPRWDVDVDVVATAGDQVVLVGTYLARAAWTGRSVTTRSAQLWTVRDGRVVGFEEIVDASRLVASLIAAQPSIP
jgi:ketosteroid isomerase-like protein